MPRTNLSASAELAATRTADESVLLLTITFTAPAPFTLRVSDAYRDYRSQGGYEWLPLVESWGNLVEQLNHLEPGGAPSTAEITFFNDKPVAGRDRLSDLIRTPGNTGTCYEFTFAQVQVDRLDPGGAPGDETTLGAFRLEDPQDIGDHLLTLRMTDESLALDQTRAATTLITQELFPKCDPADEGKSIPVPIGRLTNVPCRAVIAGRNTTLDGTLDETGTTVTLDDVAGFNDGDTIQIDLEHITLGSRRGRTFTGCTREANSTTGTAHSDEAVVMPVLASYVYVAGEVHPDFPAAAISNIKTAGIAARTSPTTELVGNLLDDGTERRFATIRFTPSSVAAFHGAGAAQTGTFSPTSISFNDPVRSGVSTVSLPATFENGSAPTTRVFSYQVGSSANITWELYRRIKGGAWNLIDSGSPGAPALPHAGSHTATYDNGIEEEIKYVIISGSGYTTSVSLLSYTASGTNVAGQAGRSTAAAVIGDVTCDLFGVSDSAPPTITQGPNALLENPAHAIQFLLTKRYGALRPLGSTWAKARVRLDGHAWSALFGEDGAVPFDEFRRMVERHSRCRLFMDGGRWELAYQDDAPAADVTLDYDRDVWDRVPMQVSRTERTRIFNSIVVKSQRDPSTGNYGRTTRVEDLTQPGLTSRIETTLELPWVQLAATADMLGAYWLARQKRLRFRVALVAYQNVLALMQADTFTIRNHPILAAHGTPVFRIVGKEYLLGDDNQGRIKLVAVEA